MTKSIFTFAIFIFLTACQKTEIVFNGEADDNLELPLILRINGKNCMLDAENGVLKYSIDENSLDNFSPYVEFQAYSNVIFGTTKLTNSAINYLGDLELNKAYPLIIDTRDETNVFTLLFTDIPIIQLVTHDPIINGPKTLTRLTINYPVKERKSDVNWVGIEQRGSSSLRYDKKSFGIEVFSDKRTELSLSQSYFDLKSNTEWVLDAMFIDRSRLRSKTSFDLWNSMAEAASHIGIKSRFVEVFINHQSRGIYCFTEKYTEDFLDLNSSSVLYKGMDNSDITSFLALSKKIPYSKIWGNWEQEFPNPSKTIVWNDFEELSKLIVNGSDEEFTNNIASHINLNNFIDYFLFVNLCGAKDNVGKNCFFLKDDPSGKFHLIPWDLDRTWGRSRFGEEVPNSIIITNNLFNRLEENDPKNYKLRLKKRWEELRMLEFSESNLNKLFATNFDELKSYEIIDSENKIWNIGLNLEHEHLYIASWIKKRLEFLDEYFGN